VLGENSTLIFIDKSLMLIKVNQMLKNVIACLLSYCVFIPAVHAHHSITAHYDPMDVRTITGRLDSVNWRNPHTIFEFTETNEEGNKTWYVEAGAINTIRRMGVNADLIKEGDEVTFIGLGHRTEANRLIAANLIHDSKEYVVFGPLSKALRMKGTVEEEIGYTTSATAYRVNSESAADIFRVWSPIKFPLTAVFPIELPLKEPARKAFEAYDEASNDLALKCEPPGMPSMLDNPYPMEVVAHGDHILMRFEEWDAERRVYMNGTIPNDAQISRYGHSLGKWENGELIIETKNIDYPFFDDAGVPMSDQMVVTERYSISEDRKQLNWTATMVDPEVFTAPVSYGGYMVWSPGIEIQVYGCDLAD
jgi:hypothetical protein